MRPLILLHIAAGGLGLLTGYVALYAAKGARLHRKAGTIFVYAMATMALTGAGIAALDGVEASVIAGLSATYLVVTALTTVRPASPWTRRVDRAALVLGLAVGLTAVVLGGELLVSGGARDGVPAYPFFILGLPALLGGLSDLRILRSGPPRGAARIARHLWRMSYALLIAALSFFLGQADKLPEVIRIPALLALPIVAVLASMVYWLWRVRIRRSLSGLARVEAS